MDTLKLMSEMVCDAKLIAAIDATLTDGCPMSDDMKHKLVGHKVRLCARVEEITQTLRGTGK